MIVNKNFVNVTQVQSTNDACIVSKCSMSKNNYFKDKFVKWFVKKEEKRAPLIHLGYCTRAIILCKVLENFVDFMKCHAKEKFQIISFGAGFDTSYWRLTETCLLPENCLFVEIDYPDVINHKISLILQSEELKSYLKNMDISKYNCLKQLSTNYYMLCADLHDVRTVDALLKVINISYDTVTLFLSECAITYMKEKESASLLEWVTKNFPKSVFINYEQIHPEDDFGVIMLRHFAKLQSNLQSVYSYPDCESHRQRYKKLGFKVSVAVPEWDFFDNVTSYEERKRIFNLEPFDEFEEFHLKCSHYVLAIAQNYLNSNWIQKMGIVESTVVDEYCINSEFSLERTDINLEIFGHASCTVEGNFLIFGGYGNKGRSKKVTAFTKNKVNEIQIRDAENHQFDAVHGSVVSFELNGVNYVGLYGGRSSPNNIINNGEVLLLAANEHTLCRKAVISTDFTPRYRSSIVCQSIGTSTVSLWIFGGRTADLKTTLSDLWQLNITSNPDGTISCVQIQKERNPSPGSRMSHSAVINSDADAMYVTGGLDMEKFKVLNDIWKWSFLSESWERMRPRNRLLVPRYGHTSHIEGKTLYLLGGVNAHAGCQPGLAVFHIDTLHLIEYSLKVDALCPVLLFNHTSEIKKDDEGHSEIHVIGGGGNCFSFGTYFNKTTHILRPESLKSY